MPNSYGVDSIKTMEFGEAANKRIGMYLSADTEEAIFLGLREIICNSVDEYLQGYGNKIDINIDTINQIFSVEDYGRGIPVGTRPDGSNSLIAALSLPHTGGKLDTENYNSAIGTNGIGASVVTHTAEFLDAVVCRDGSKYTVYFDHTDKGAVTSGVQKVASSTKTGTRITYKPSLITYEGSRLNIESLKNYLDELQYLTPGLTFNLTIDGVSSAYLSRNGLVDALVSKDRIHKNVINYKTEIDGVKIEFALQWAKKPLLRAFANSLYMPDGGDFMTGFKTSLTKTFNSIAETDFSGELIRKYLDGFVSIKVKTPQFSNQAKTSLANKEARAPVSKAIGEALKQFFTAYPKDLEAILKIITTEQKAEKAAQRAREAVNKVAAGGKTVNALKDLSSKLADCTKLGGEIFLCEGE